MNADRRATAAVCIALINEGIEAGELRGESHVALEHALKTMRQNEFWSLKSQSAHAGSNASTDGSIAISKVALPALEAAESALVKGDYVAVAEKLDLAATVTADQAKEAPKRRRRAA